jgi:ribosomal 50S subunit-recycling heat shock protein
MLPKLRTNLTISFINSYRLTLSFIFEANIIKRRMQKHENKYAGKILLQREIINPTQSIFPEEAIALPQNKKPVIEKKRTTDN